ncbi:MAG: dephospho-CoA kinase [Caldimicrobium sp.]|jgi:dephospho-CoA kinase
MLKKIAITGGIATGKSTLLGLLRELGFPCISCDEIVKKIYQREDIQKNLIELFGKEVLNKDRNINVKFILEKILANSNLKRNLENLIHPEVLKEIFHFFAEIKEKGEKICFVEVPLLFEVAWEKYFDEIWVITCSEDVQKERIKRLKGSELYLDLSKCQIALKEKEKMAHKIFSSEVPVEELKESLKTLLKEYLKE